MQPPVLSVLRGVVGSSVVGVRYLVPAGTRWAGAGEAGSPHEVDHGVELVLANGRTLSVRWEMEGENEYLSLVDSSSADELSTDLIDVVDVSSSPEWSSIAGQVIVDLGVAWHVPDAGCPQAVWALRFGLENRASFVIALGEVREGVPAYLPDAVLVLFQEEEAKSYRTAGSGTSAWGDTLSTYAE